MKATLPPWFQREGLALLTDFYQLTMMAGQMKEARADRLACFEYFFRSLPPHTGFAVTAGLASFLDYLEHLHFDEDDLAYLGGLGIFDKQFLERLRAFRPSCTVCAMPEGTLAFPYEPIVTVEGAIFEAQLVETALLNLLNYPTLIATKAARVCLAANGDPVMEFGLRRAHGPDGGVSGSRAAYIGGCTSTSNVMAGKLYGIPVAGTHAHSWVMSFPSELEAFRAFARHYPNQCTLLVDTYDTVSSGIPNAVRVFLGMREEGHNVRPAIRLDSGDLAKLSNIAHAAFREAGFDNPLIVGSNDLDEDLIADLKRQGAKINAWGVGTHLITAHDCPALSGVYKLAAIHTGEQWQPRMKLTSNPEKATDPGRKELVRFFDESGHPVDDVMYARDEPIPEPAKVLCRSRMHPERDIHLQGAVRSQRLLETVFEDGVRKYETPPLQEIRAHAQHQIASLPDEYKRLRNPGIYHNYLSPAIGNLKEHMLAHPEQA